MRVLIVDDEPRYRAYLREFLGSQGHEVAVAGSGTEAIGIGIRFQPQLLLTDWMLRNHFHGLHVARALRAIEPGMPAILMTGFPSEELRAEARGSRVFQFIEKPFEVETLRLAVLRASHDTEVRRDSVPFGVIVADENGFIVAASEKARTMFSRTDTGTRPGRLSDLFGLAALESLGETERGWVRVGPRATGRIRWWARSRKERGYRVFVLLPERRKYLRVDPRVTLLLDLPPPATGPLEPGTRVLIVDARSSLQPTYLAALDDIGCIAYRASDPSLARRLFREESSIDLVVVDGISSMDVESLLADLRSIRPGVEIVGVSNTREEAARFAKAGVVKQLQRSWRVGDLVQLVAN